MQSFDTVPRGSTRGICVMCLLLAGYWRGVGKIAAPDDPAHRLCVSPRPFSSWRSLASASPRPGWSNRLAALLQ